VETIATVRKTRIKRLIWGIASTPTEITTFMTVVGGS
jgi:hypothetical protein